MLPLVLYDIPSKLPGNTWSSNPARPRFILSYKKLPFETVWVEFPDIAPTLKGIGAAPSKRADGSEQYTVPVLSDPNTGALITDSWTIAEYLDKTYPEKPIFPNGSKGLISAFNSALTALMGAGFRLTFLRVASILNDRSLEYFITTREKILGVKMDEWSPEGPARDAHWAVIEKDYFGSARTWYQMDEGKWLMGNTFSYADILIATHILLFKVFYQADEWKRVAALHNGKWGKLLAEVEKECNVAQTSYLCSK